MSGRIITLSMMTLVLMGQNIDINTGTKGTLNINRGGTAATTAAQALSNLGGIGASTTDTLTNKTLTNPRINAILDTSNGSVVVQILAAGGATEGLSVTPSTAGNPVVVSTFGSGSNVDLTLDPKGVGILRMPNADEILFGDGTTGQFMRKAANGRMEWANISGTGTVTSVGLTGVSGIITVTGSPITTSGTLALSLNSQAQNAVFAGPSSGSGTPTFRSLVAGDIPNLDAAKITTGVIAAARLLTGGPVPGRCVEIDGSNQIVAAANPCGTGSGGGVTSLNSQTGVVLLTGGSTGSDYNISSSGGTITINLPDAGASSRGLLSSSNWNTFNNKVSGPGTPTVVGNLASWANTSGTQLGTGFQYSESGIGSTIAMRDFTGGLSAYGFSATTSVSGQSIMGAPLSDQVAGTFKRFSATQGNVILRLQSELGVDLATFDKTGNFSGKAATTDAFASNPANCVNPGEAAAGISATGVAEGCFVPTATITGNGLSIYNVKDSPYSAVGDGSNDDTAEIQAAIDACHDSTRGGIVFLPPGTYAISSTLYQGNGNGNTVSTKKPCHIKGSGGGPGPASTSTAIGASVIKWTGSAPGSITYAFEMRGPFVGGGISEVTIDLNDKSNLRGVLWENVSHGWSHNLSIINYRSTGLVLTSRSTDAGPDYGTCDNYFSHLRIMRNSTGGNGMSLLGNDVSGGRDSCSNTFYAPMLWHDNGTSGTFGLELGFADNNRFFGLNIYGFPESSTNGSGIKFVQQSTNAGFPHENTFMSVSAHQGVTGTMGSGQPNIFYDWHLGDCFHNCDPYSVSGSVKPIVFSTDRSLKGVTVPGDFVYASTDENNETVTINHSSGGQNGAGNIFFKRTGSNIGRIKSHYFDGLTLYTSDGSGGSPLPKLQLKNSGVVSYKNTLSRGTISGLTAEVGDTAFCTDCQRDASCSASGTGAIAKAITAGTGIGNWACN